MKKSFGLLFLLTPVLSLIISMVMVRAVSAHQSVTVGGYQLEIGWLDEPPVVGQRNAIVLNISLASPAPGDEKAKPIDISKLNLAIIYGGETKPLTLQPLSEDSQNQYTAPLLPTRPGKYTLTISGSIGTSPANIAVQPEEVETAGSLQFPLAANPDDPGGGLSLPVGLAAAALLVAIAALAISVLSLRKNRR